MSESSNEGSPKEGGPSRPSKHSIPDEPSFAGAFEVHKVRAALAAEQHAEQQQKESGEGHGHSGGHGHGAMSGLVLAALGIVFGDIGTSPLYALKE
jgi:hypothetical protein